MDQELNSYPESHILGLYKILELLKYLSILKVACTKNSLVCFGLRVHLLPRTLYLT